MPENMEHDPNLSESGGATDLFTFHYIQSNQFRVIHVDGMIGGPSPAMDGIQMALFSEREPIPLSVAFKLSEDGSPEEIRREGRDGITREVDVNAIMSIDTAERLGTWLLEQVESLREFQDRK